MVMGEHEPELWFAMCVDKNLGYGDITLLRASSLILNFTIYSSVWLVIFWSKFDNLSSSSSLIES